MSKFDEWAKDPDAYEAKIAAEDKVWRANRACMQSNVMPLQPGESLYDFPLSRIWRGHYEGLPEPDKIAEKKKFPLIKGDEAKEVDKPGPLHTLKKLTYQLGQVKGGLTYLEHKINTHIDKSRTNKYNEYKLD